jgi:hypothetical protein
VTITDFTKKFPFSTVVFMDESVLSAVLDQVSNVTTEGRKSLEKYYLGKEVKY